MSPLSTGVGTLALVCSDQGLVVGVTTGSQVALALPDVVCSVRCSKASHRCSCGRGTLGCLGCLGIERESVTGALKEARYRQEERL